MIKKLNYFYQCINNAYFSSVVGKLYSLHGLDMETLYKKTGKLNTTTVPLQN